RLCHSERGEESAVRGGVENEIPRYARNDNRQTTRETDANDSKTWIKRNWASAMSACPITLVITGCSLEFDFRKSSRTISCRPHVRSQGMFTGSRLLALMSCLFFIPSWAIGQQPASSSGSPANTPAPEPQSLADMARKLRKDKPADNKMNEQDDKEHIHNSS